MKKRLLKDLPFSDVNAGVVITHNSYRYYIQGDLSFCTKWFNRNENLILDEIWNNPKWFENATLEHIDLIISTTRISLKFKPIDIRDVKCLTKGIVHVFKHLSDGNYTWNNFKNFTTAILGVDNKEM